MIDKGKLFRKAWRMAKRAAAETGEKAVKFFSESLKIVWKDMKESIEWQKKREEEREARFVKTLRLSFEYITRSKDTLFVLSNESVTTYAYKDFIKTAGFKWDGYMRVWYKEISLEKRTHQDVAEQAKEIKRMFLDKENIELILDRESYRSFCRSCLEEGILSE